MSDHTGEKAPESPDYLKVPTKGDGTRRLNNVPKIVGCVILAFAGSAVGYTVWDKDRMQNQVNEEAARVYKVTAPAVAAVKKPDGPDVYRQTTVPTDKMEYTPEGAPIVPDDALKQAQAKRFAAYESARLAAPGVAKFSQHRQSTTGQIDYRIPSGQPDYRGLVPPPPPPPPGYGDEYGEGRGEGDINNQAGKMAFFKQAMDGGLYLKGTRVAPLSPYQINAGWLIPGVMVSGINSDSPGECLGQVRQDVFDSATGMILLIPAGSKLTCIYDSNVSPGQESALVAFKEIKFPDGSSLNLEGMPGANQSGFAGFDGVVDNHYLRKFGTAVMLSVITAGTMLATTPRGNYQNGGISPQSIISASLGMQLGRMGMQSFARDQMIQSTIRVDPGFEFAIIVTKDFVLPPYVPMKASY